MGDDLYWGPLGHRPHIDGVSDWNEGEEWARIKKAEEAQEVREIRKKQVLVRGDRVHLTEPYGGMEARTSGVVAFRSFRKTHVFVLVTIEKRTRCVSIPKELLYKLTFPKDWNKK
jgi:hypothetical protein